ncbi:MAG: NAD-dependent epimerase/dehydratase family protein [Pirellulales bacterium]|nr:NAD-dependent epimerase/dehydratase family protein [Pirellulales bacterium]
MRALVTGAGGFLGRYIAEQLVARGDRVRAYCRGRYPALDALGVESVRGDITDRDGVLAACEKIDCVFHVAAVAGIGGSWSDYWSINTRGTEHVIAGCRAHRVPRLVYTSSSSVTFTGQDQEGIDELAPYPQADQWLAHYPHSKALAEQAVLAANAKEGLATTALRPHLIWGPRDNHLVPRLLARARSGRLRRVGDGSNRIDMTYVDNTAAAHLAVADALTSPDAPPAGKAYFISQGEPVNCWDWINEILNLAHMPPVERSLSLQSARRIGAMCEWIWRLCRLRGEPPMTRFLAAQLATPQWFNIRAARQDFGYFPHISTQEGMRRLGEWLALAPAKSGMPLAVRASMRG